MPKAWRSFAIAVMRLSAAAGGASAVVVGLSVVLLMACVGSRIEDAEAGSVDTGVALSSDVVSISLPDQPLYRADTTRYYVDRAAWLRDVAEVRQRANEIAQLRASIGSEPAVMLRALELNAALRVPLDRLWIYSSILADQDTDNSAPAAEYARLENEVNSTLAFLEDTVGGLDQKVLADFVAREPALAKYERAVAEWRRARSHRLPEAEETLLSEFEGSTQAWSWQLYSQTRTTAPFGSVTTGGKTYDVRTNFDVLMQLADRDARREAYTNRLTAFKARQAAFASNALRVANEAHAAAIRRRFGDALEATFFGLYLTPASVDAVLQGFRTHVETARRFQRANRTYVANRLGLPEAQPWDLEAPLSGASVPAMTIADASDAIRAATAVFGPRYRAHLDAILEPRNGRIDLVGGTRRSHQDITRWPFGGEPVLFMEKYDGSTTTVVTLAHESTHAVHFGLIREANVSWYQAFPPGFVVEGLAKLNELRVLDELHKRASTPGERIYYLRQLAARLASVKYTTMYWAALATSFEIEVNRHVARSDGMTGDQVHDTWLSLGERFSDGYAKIPDHAYTWADTPNFFERPRTYVKYLYAWVFASALYAKIQADPRVATAVVEFMRQGSPEEPVPFIRRTLGIDLDSPTVLDDAFRLLEQRVTEFEAAVTPNR